MPASAWLLGGVSLFMDFSSEWIHALLPLLLVGPLGASMALVGWIEGVAEATASFTRIGSGWLSDHIARRRPLLLVGYGLAAASKPAFPLAQGPLEVLLARCADRVGKGIRGAPRDALIADVTAPQLRGAAYGLRQALDSVGAVLGPLAAMAGLMLWPGQLRRVLGWAVMPALLAFLLLLQVREPAPAAAGAAKPHRGGDGSPAHALGAAGWRVIAVGAAVALARFSEAFLVLRAAGLGMALAQVPLVMVVMNIAYAGGAYPAGRWADRLPARPMLVAGLVLLAAADGFLAAAHRPAFLWCGAVLWGAHMAVTQGVLSRLVANAAPPEARGRAFGWFYFVTGVATLASGVVAGWAWSRYGGTMTFVLGAALAGLALASLPLLPARRAAPVAG